MKPSTIITVSDTGDSNQIQIQRPQQRQIHERQNCLHQ